MDIDKDGVRIQRVSGSIDYTVSKEKLNSEEVLKQGVSNYFSRLAIEHLKYMNITNYCIHNISNVSAVSLYGGYTQILVHWDGLINP